MNDYSTQTKPDNYQIKILKGLRNFGEEIASFYEDGIEIINNENLKTKPYLLAHILREIECGFRDIFRQDREKDHKESINVVLGIDKSNEFSEKWYLIAKKFHKYSHRRGAWKEPRDFKIVKQLWDEFEEILYQLVGNYYNIIRHIDRIIKREPTENSIKKLINLLKIEPINPRNF